MSQENIEDLIERGFELLDEEDFDGAIEIGKELRAKRHSSGFEILAIAHYQQGDTERAVKILEEGTNNAPTDWVLWMTLGNCRSDLGEFRDAHAAFERALGCPDVDESGVYLNIAIAHSRENNVDQALAALDSVGEDLQSDAEAVRMGLFNRQGKYEEVISRGEKLLPQLASVEDSDLRSGLLVDLGQAYWKGRGSEEKAVQLALAALELRPGFEHALWLIRAVKNEVSETAAYMRIIVQGDWHEPGPDGEELSFFRTYDIIADDIDEALDYIRAIEPEPVRDSVVVDESDILEENASDPKGVYRYTGHILYARNDDTD